MKMRRFEIENDQLRYFKLDMLKEKQSWNDRRDIIMASDKDSSDESDSEDEANKINEFIVKNVAEQNIEDDDEIKVDLQKPVSMLQELSTTV